MKPFTLWLLSLITLICSGCCEEPEPEPEPEPAPSGYRCVGVLDNQTGNPTDEDCHFDYPPNQEVLDHWGLDLYGENLKCSQDTVLVAETPGYYRFYGECGTQAGYVNVLILEGENPEVYTYLEGSLCMRTEPALVITPLQPELYLDSYFGYSTGTRCGNWIYDDFTAEKEVTIRLLELECATTPCDPSQGKDYVRVRGKVGESIDTHPSHLTLVGIFNRIPPGDEVTIRVTAVEAGPWNQEISFPVTVRNGP